MPEGTLDGKKDHVQAWNDLENIWPKLLRIRFGAWGMIFCRPFSLVSQVFPEFFVSLLKSLEKMQFCQKFAFFTSREKFFWCSFASLVCLLGLPKKIAKSRKFLFKEKENKCVPVKDPFLFFGKEPARKLKPIIRCAERLLFLPAIKNVREKEKGLQIMKKEITLNFL